jgi:hypothetical protein
MSTRFFGTFLNLEPRWYSIKELEELGHSEEDLGIETNWNGELNADLKAVYDK